MAGSFRGPAISTAWDWMYGGLANLRDLVRAGDVRVPVVVFAAERAGLFDEILPVRVQAECGLRQRSTTSKVAAVRDSYSTRDNCSRVMGTLAMVVFANRKNVLPSFAFADAAADRPCPPVRVAIRYMTNTDPTGRDRCGTCRTPHAVASRNVSDPWRAATCRADGDRIDLTVD